VFSLYLENGIINNKWKATSWCQSSGIEGLATKKGLQNQWKKKG